MPASRGLETMTPTAEIVLFLSHSAAILLLVCWSSVLLVTTNLEGVRAVATLLKELP